MTNQSHTELAAFDRAVAEELPRVSHLEYDSHEICKHFAGKLRERLSAALESLERVLGEATAWKRCEACNGKGDSASGRTACGGCQGSGRVAAPNPPTAPAQALLYEHEDGRMAVNVDTTGDPGWHRVGPVEVFGMLSPQAPERAVRNTWPTAASADLPLPEHIAATSKPQAERVPMEYDQMREFIETHAEYDLAGWRVWGLHKLMEFIKKVERRHGIVTKESSNAS